jgi:hypothetical protein
MTWKKVTGYELELQDRDADSSLGKGTLFFEEGAPVTITKLAADFSAMVDVLRHEETPVWFEDRLKILVTSAEPPADRISGEPPFPIHIPQRPVRVRDTELDRVLH